MISSDRRARIEQLLGSGVEKSEIYTIISEEFGCTRGAVRSATARILQASSAGDDIIENDGEETDFAKMDFESSRYHFTFFRGKTVENTFSIPFHEIQDYVEAYVHDGKGMTRKQVAHFAWVKYERKLTHDYVRRVFRCIDVMKSSLPVAPHRYEEESLEEIADTWHARDEAMLEAHYRSKSERRLTNRLRKATESLLKIQDFIVTTVEEAEIVQLPPTTWVPVPFEGKSDPIHAVMMLSDWHIGLQVDQWYNQFDNEVADIRVEELLDQLNEYAKMHKGEIASYSNAWLGDMLDSVHANMHADQHMEQDLYGVDQVLCAASLMAKFNHGVSQIFGMDIHNFATPGNHDRASQSRGGDVQRLPGLLAYYLAEAKFPMNRPWEIASDRTLLEKSIGGHMVIMGHGDRVPRKISQMARPRLHLGVPIVVLSGHLHSLLADGVYDSQFTHLRNGSLCGSTGYSFDQLGMHQRPAQAICELTPRGVRLAPLFLEEGFEPVEPL